MESACRNVVKPQAQGGWINPQQKEKYKDAPSTAIDLFRDLHCSSKRVDLSTLCSVVTPYSVMWKHRFGIGY
ncbi:unnamed protein product [Urochloa humidicola]